MEKCLKALVIAVFTILLAGCAKNESVTLTEQTTPVQSSKEQPPLPAVSTGSTAIRVVQSSYCWEKLGCADYVGGKAMFKGIAPTMVRPEAELSITLDYKIQPSEVYVSEIQDNNQYNPVHFDQNSFKLPSEKGVYYYQYSANWLSENHKYTLNQTTAVFAVEIQ